MQDEAFLHRGFYGAQSIPNPSSFRRAGHQEEGSLRLKDMQGLARSPRRGGLWKRVLESVLQAASPLGGTAEQAYSFLQQMLIKHLL